LHTSLGLAVRHCPFFSFVFCCTAIVRVCVCVCVCVCEKTRSLPLLSSLLFTPIPPFHSSLPPSLTGRMIIPRIDLTADDCQAQLGAYRLLPNQVLVAPTADNATLHAILKSQNKDAFWVQPAQFDSQDPLAQIHMLLDAGSDKVVLPYAAFAADASAFAHIPQERLAVALTLPEFEHVQTSLLSLVSVFILTINDTPNNTNIEAIKRVAQTAQAGLLPRGGIKRVVASFSEDTAPQLTSISDLGRAGIDILLSSNVLSTDIQEGKLNLGQTFMSTVVSDRADGLFPTVVVDEQGISLGLVYSSLDSVVESFKTGKGVYFSRTRGLWHKGASSGSTQDLIKVHVDCDSDALQFTVHQHGTGMFVRLAQCNIGGTTVFSTAK